MSRKWVSEGITLVGRRHSTWESGCTIRGDRGRNTDLRSRLFRKGEDYVGKCCTSRTSRERRIELIESSRMLSIVENVDAKNVVGRRATANKNFNSIYSLSILCHAHILPTWFVPEGAFQPMFTLGRHCCPETRQQCKVKCSLVSECNGKFNEPWLFLSLKPFFSYRRPFDRTKISEKMKGKMEREGDYPISQFLINIPSTLIKV